MTLTNRLLIALFGIASIIQTLDAQWTAVAPLAKNTNTQALTVSGSKIVAGTATGAYISTDNGLNWVGTTSGLTTADVRSVAVSPSGTSIYAGTVGGGVFISTNNGAAWTASNTGMTTLDVRALAFVGSTLFAGTYGGGVFRSLDNGSTWYAMNLGLTSKYIVCFASSGNYLFAGTDGGGICVSSDGGANWTAANSGLTNLVVSSIALSGTTLLAGTYGGGLFRSTNDGGTWTAVNSGVSNLYVWSVSVSGSTVFAGTNGGVLRSTNLGATWSSVNNGLMNTTVRATAVMGTTVFAGTFGGGVYSTQDNGATWTNGPVNPYVMILGVTGGDLYVGTYGGIHRTSDNGATWTDIYKINVPSRASQSFAFSGPNLFSGISILGVYASHDNGVTWNLYNSGMTNYDVRAMAVSASGTKVFAGTAGSGVFISYDKGVNWTASNSGLNDPYIFSFVVSGAKLFAGVNGGVYLSTNDGASWTAANAGISSTRTWALAVIGSKLFAGTATGVFISTNNGASWTRAANGIASTDIRSFAVNGSNIYAGTYGGIVYGSSNEGDSWTQINAGLPSKSVYALTVSGQYLFAGIYGSGLWKRPLADVTGPAVPTLLAPLNGEKGLPMVASLQWTGSNDIVTYRLHMSYDSLFVTTALSRTGLSASAFDAGPLDAGTTYYWRVNASNAFGTSEWSSARRFTTGVVGPVLIQPVDKAVNVAVAPLLKWNAVTGAVSYRVQVSDSAAPGTPVVDVTVVSDLSYQASGLANGRTYLWRIYSADGSGQGTWSVLQKFTTVVAVPPAPMLSSPPIGAVDVSPNTVFQWKAAMSASSYHMQVSTDSVFTTTTVNITGLSVPTYAASGLPPKTRLYWRVNATNAGGAGVWSDVWTFTTNVATPVPPVLTLPADGATNVPTSTSLAWDASDGATSYDIQLSTDAEFGTLILDQSSNTTRTLAIAGLSSYATYYWHVRAANTIGNGLWSARRSFTTALSLPAKVTLYSPSATVSIGADSVRFTWLRAQPAVTSYEFELTGDSTSVRVAFDTTITARVPAGKTEKAYVWRVRAKNLAGFGPFSDTRSMLRLTTSVTAADAVPHDHVVFNNYPNPFNPTTTFAFTIPKAAYVVITIFDAFGRETAVVASREFQAGTHSCVWNAEGMPSGMYFYRVTAGSYTETKRIIYLK